MNKKIVQFAAVCLAAVLCFPGVGTSAAAAEGEEQIIKVGLSYGSSALPGANLSNVEGTGYRFGYFDDSRTFYQTGYTNETDISVVKTENVWYGYVESYGRWTYSDQIQTDVGVGCYHIQLPTVYPSYEEARAAADTVGGTGFPAWIDGTYYVREGCYLTREDAEARLTAWGVEGAIVGTSAYAVSVVRTGTNTVLFQFDGGERLALAVAPGQDPAEKAVTLFRGYSYYGAFQYQRRGGGNMTVVNFVPLEDYVKGVVPHEMSASWPLEALKAQAVCARTYSVLNLEKHGSDGFDLCATTDCQMYLGRNSANQHSDQAVEETTGQYVWYGNELAETFYFSCDGGATEDVKNVWGSSIPYLKGVVDPYEGAVADKTGRYGWTRTFTKAQLKEILHSKGRMCDDIVDFYIAETTPTGNVFKITFLDAAGKSWSFQHNERGREYCRTLLGLYSNRYTISGGGGNYYVNGQEDALSSVLGAYAIGGDGTVIPIQDTPYVVTASGTEPLTITTTGDSFTITGSGWGHNVGMSQWGAYAMAQQGKTYEEILTFYFTGVDVR